MLYQPGNLNSVGDYLSLSRESNCKLDDAADVETETQKIYTNDGCYALQAIWPSKLAAVTDKNECSSHNYKVFHKTGDS